MNRIFSKAQMLFVSLALLLLIGCAAHSPASSSKSEIDTAAPAQNKAQGKKDNGEEGKIITENNIQYKLISTPFGIIKKRLTPVKTGSAKLGNRKAVAEPVVPTRHEPNVKNKIPVKINYYKKPTQLPDPPKGKESLPESNGNLVLNFDNADLNEVIRTFSEMLGINYIVDANIQGSVTIQTSKPLNEDSILPIFYQILEINGLTAVKDGELHRIIDSTEASRFPIVSSYGKNAKNAPVGEFILQIIPLSYISAQEMSKLVSNFLSNKGSIVLHEVSNTMIVIDKRFNVLKVLKLVETFDASIFNKVQHKIFEVKNAEPMGLVKTLYSIISNYGFEKEDVSLIPIPRLGSLMAISKKPDVFQKVGEYIQLLDAPAHETEPQIYVYSVKNGQAQELSVLLDNIFIGAMPTNQEKSTDTLKDSQDAEKNGDMQTPFGKLSSGKASAVGSQKVTTSFQSGSIREKIRITPDEIRNILIIEALPSDYRIVENILRRLDVLPRQVLIEVTIADISLDTKNELGVDWAYTYGTRSPSIRPVGSEDGETFESISIGNAGLQYLIGERDRWKAMISALATQNKANILSTPTVLASDNKEATINISTEIPVASSSYENTESNVITTHVEYRNTGLILSVTPHINENGLVSMDISQEVSEQTGDTVVADVSYPSFFKRTVKTSLVVKHEQTIVLGGLIRKTKSDGKSGVPVLSKLPGVGFLFGKDSETYQKSELILLITPRVIISLEDVDAVTSDFKYRVSETMGKL